MDNQTFIRMVFGDDAPHCHVTDFANDPNDIPEGMHLMAWRGDWASNYHLQEGTNQYFTISVFKPDEHGVARRRKALYLRTPCIVLDDVKEKLDVEQASKLPEPSWILETSPGSEQWGYILDTPCEDRGRVENLLDGLVANGLAPDGRDPGMKGVTRYVRLPGGYNTKRSKMVDGQPFKCVMKKWQPFCRSTMEQLAAPFAVDLEAPRREARVDGAADIPDHPLLQIPDLIYIKGAMSKGRFDITCPWVDEHTNAIDNGAAMFTNKDGSMGFKCHHGACEARTGKDLMNWVERQAPGFRDTYNSWQMKVWFGEAPAPLSFIEPVALPPVETETTDPAALVMNKIHELSHMLPTAPERSDTAESVLKACESLGAMHQKRCHEELMSVQGWSKTEFSALLKGLRKEWYETGGTSDTFYDDFIFVHDINRIYNQKLGIFYTTDSFRNSHIDRDPEVLKMALQERWIKKVHRLEFAPKKPPIFQEGGLTCGNIWNDDQLTNGTPGDISPWLEHMRTMGIAEEHIWHLIQWMAYTIRHPDKKINYMILLGGDEGIGKDFILNPIVVQLARYTKTIEGHALLSNFNSYLIGTKLLLINETELFDHRDASSVGASLKPLAAAPPKKLRVNQKNIPELEINNIVNCIMTTNARTPMKLDGHSRRFFALWSDLNVRDVTGEITPSWVSYFEKAWGWMNNGGDQAVIDYLMNQVDLSAFSPGRSPPMTQFLRDITNSSKSPGLQAIEHAVDKKMGLFKSDLLTAKDISTMMVAGHMIPEMAMFSIKPQWFNPVNVGKMMSSCRWAKQLRCRRDGQEFKPYALRNTHHYAKMSETELYFAYAEQLEAARNNVPAKTTLRVVDSNTKVD